MRGAVYESGLVVNWVNPRWYVLCFTRPCCEELFQIVLVGRGLAMLVRDLGGSDNVRVMMLVFRV